MAEMEAKAFLDTLDDRLEEKQELKLGDTCRGGSSGVLGQTG